MGNETAAELLQRINSEDLLIGKAEKILKQSLKAPAANSEPAREKTLLQICVEQAETAEAYEKDVRGLSTVQTAASPIIALQPFKGLKLSAFSPADFVGRTGSEMNGWLRSRQYQDHRRSRRS